MSKRRKTRPNGVLTVIVIVGGAALLILLGNWVEKRQPRRVPISASQAGQVRVVPEPAGEIEDEERQRLQHILEKGSK